MPPGESSSSIGVPIKVLHEAEGHIITLETSSGELFRGKLIEAEDNMNCQLHQVQYTARTGQHRTLEMVYIRGSKIRYLILPDMLKNAPMFRRAYPKAEGAQRGRRGVGAPMGIKRGLLSSFSAYARGRGGRGRAGGGGGSGGGSMSRPRGSIFAHGVGVPSSRGSGTFPPAPTHRF